MKANNLFQRLHESYQEDPEYLTIKLVVDINETILERMEKLSISQSELAEKIGVKQSYLSRLFNHSTNMTIKTLVSIACALDLEVMPTILRPKATKPIISSWSSKQSWQPKPVNVSSRGQNYTDQNLECESEKSDNLAYAA